MKNDYQNDVFDHGDAKIIKLEKISDNLNNLIDEYLIKLFFNSSDEDIESLINGYNNELLDIIN